MCLTDDFYCAEIVNFTILALLSEAFGKFRNIWQRVTDDVRGANRKLRREVKWQYRQKMARGRKPRTHEKLRIEFLM